MSSTKNTKDNRQVVRAVYHVPESVFEIPDGLDLEDKSVVKWWCVKYNTLKIKYVNGEEVTFAPKWDAAHDDFKRPTECEIILAEDVGYEYFWDTDEDEEDEDEEEEEVVEEEEEVVEEDEDEDDDDMDGWSACEFDRAFTVREFKMAEGNHLWSYIVKFNASGDQVAVYAENEFETKLLKNQSLISRFKKGVEYVKLVDGDWKPSEDSDEALVNDY